MNILEFDNHPLSAINFNPKKAKSITYICNHAMAMTFISHIYRAVGPFGEKFDFLVPWDLKQLNTKPTNYTYI